MIPLLILWIGIGDVEKIAVIFLGTLFQLTFLIADVSAHVPKELLQVAYTLGARKRDVTLRVLIPASFPGIMDNLRITMGWAWTYLIVAELVSAERGLGYMILQAMRGMQTDVIFVGLFVIGLLGLITDQTFKYLTIWLLPWSEKASI
jgi:NitT/TauT family transport system permease protein